MVRNSLRGKFEFDGVPLRLLLRYKGRTASKPAVQRGRPKRSDSAGFMRRNAKGGSESYGKERRTKA